MSLSCRSIAPPSDPTATEFVTNTRLPFVDIAIVPTSALTAATCCVALELMMPPDVPTDSTREAALPQSVLKLVVPALLLNTAPDACDCVVLMFKVPTPSLVSVRPALIAKLPPEQVTV